MTRYRIDLGYDGSGFHGYARQEGLRTIQGELEKALSTVLGATVETSVAGRTDAGVHARGQVASFETDMAVEDGLVRSLNGIVGPEIAVYSILAAAADFHARFSAKWRRYRYSIDTNPAPDPLERHRVWHVGRPLDLEAMDLSAGAFLGEHDFSSFCRSVEGSGNRRLVTHIGWQHEGGRSDLWIQANAFCQQMVRSIVGHCYDVGRGFSRAEDTAGVIAAGDRSAVITVAPPHGLTLWEVGY